MSLGEQQAAYVTPPKKGQFMRLSVSTSTQFVDLTADVTIGSQKEALFAGRYLTLKAIGGDVYVALHTDTSGTVDSTTNTAVDGTTKAPTIDGKEALMIADGTSVAFRMDGPTTPHKYLAYRGSASCQLEVWPSSPPEIKVRR